MSDVTVIGLGAMGTAIARTLLGAGYSVAVWNRTVAKAETLAHTGAERAETPARAIAASPITIVCVGNYGDTDAVLDGAASVLRGKVLIQLTTGSGGQAAALAARMASMGADYLDGVIMAYPDEMGGPKTMLLVAGPEVVWTRCEHVLRALGGEAKWVGANVSLPATLDAALLAPILGVTFGMVQGALQCEKDGFSVATYGEWLTALMPVVANSVQYLASTIAEDRFEAPQAALRTYAAAVALWEEDARARGINTEFVQSVSGILKRAMAAGHGDEELSAVIKVLRGSGHS